jgi:hypothetical protein
MMIGMWMRYKLSEQRGWREEKGGVKTRDMTDPRAREKR